MSAPLEVPLPSPLVRVRAALARRSLSDFVRLSWPVLEPATPLVWNWHLDVMCDHVQALLEGRILNNRLVINVPPGTMKSRIVSVAAPAWRWLGMPAWSGIFASGNPRVAVRDSLLCRQLVTSEWYQQSFEPAWRLAGDQNAKMLFKNTATGWRMALGVGSAVTGERAHGLFIDDPHDAATVDSKLEREGVLNWHDQAFQNRLKDMATGTRGLIMQRLHADDLAGHVLAQGGWDHLKMQQEYAAPTERRPLVPTSLGWTDPRTIEGDLLFPARFSRTVLAGERVALGPSGYAGQHQQEPAPVGGTLLKRDRWRFVGPFEGLSVADLCRVLEVQRIVLGVDTAATEKTSGDYTAIVVLAVCPTRYVVLELWAEQVEIPDAKRQVQLLAEKWGPQAVAIEGGGSASGKAVLQELKRSTRLPLVEVVHVTDKVARVSSIAPLHDAGACYVLEGAPWAADFIEEAALFPNVKHDDRVDAFTVAMRYAAHGAGGFGILEHYRQQAMAAIAEGSAPAPAGTTIDRGAEGPASGMVPGTAIFRIGAAPAP